MDNLNFNNYLNGMLIMNDKNKENRLNLFFDLLDENSNGCFSYDEIYKFSLICLQKMTLNIDDEIDNSKNLTNSKYIKIVKILAEFFSKLIFQLSGYEIDKQIPLNKLKEIALKGGEEANYIELLFGSSSS